MAERTGTDGAAAPEGTAGEDEPPATPGRAGGETERWKENGVRLRVIFYILGTHLLAGFLWLLFYVGAHSHK